MLPKEMCLIIDQIIIVYWKTFLKSFLKQRYSGAAPSYSAVAPSFYS